MGAFIRELWVYPIKGCRGVSVAAATLALTGLEVNGIGDREWVVVDADSKFQSQRELPKMVQIETRLTADSLRLKAPGMLQLDVPFDSEGDVYEIQVWNDRINAVAQGALADAWFSEFLGLRCRLMRFDPQTRRVSNRKYTGVIAAPYKFADAFALLILSNASLVSLNSRLTAKGQAPVTIERFRPNVVLDGVDAHEEDFVDHITVGSARLQVASPCVRCAVPNVDLITGATGFEPGDTLATYRDNAQAGGITFGVNAVIAHGAGAPLQVGDAVELSLRF